MKVGIPCLKLTNKHYTKAQQKKHGNAKAVVQEGLKERHSSDTSIRREDSYLNEYSGFEKGADLYDYWMKKFELHQVVDKNGKVKKMRSDAVIGFALIIKPEMDAINAMTPEEQHRFFKDSFDIINTYLKESGLHVDATAYHLDEDAPHIHLYGHDEDFKAGKKINMQLFHKFNIDYPKEMQKRGWEVEELIGYNPVDENGNILTGEALDAYKKQHIQEKKEKQHGLSSNEYKAKREAEKITADAQNEAETIIAKAKRLGKGLINKSNEYVQEQEINIKRKQQSLDERERKVSESEQKASQTLSDAMDVMGTIDVQKKILEEQERKLREREKMLKQRELTLKKGEEFFKYQQDGFKDFKQRQMDSLDSITNNLKDAVTKEKVKSKLKQVRETDFTVTDDYQMEK